MVMDSILSKLLYAHIFVDDILIILNEVKHEQVEMFEKTLKKLDGWKLSKNEFAKSECNWLGHKITKMGIEPLIRKNDPIDNL